MTTTVPAPWCRSIAEELHRIAYDLGNVVNVEGGLPEPVYAQLHIQPSGDKDEKIAAIDDIGHAVAGQPGHPIEMHDGTYHYIVEAQRGPVTFKAYTSIDATRALRMIAEDGQAQRDAEIERLRARVAELEADRTGLAYTRADDEPDDPTPVSPARVPLHTGAMTEGGLVDETPADPKPLTPEPIAAHYDATVPGDEAELCACGKSFTTSDRLRLHVTTGNAEPERAAFPPYGWHVNGCKGAVGLPCTCPKPSEIA